MVVPKKLLFITNSEYGQSSVHCSVIQELLSRPDAPQIHLLSFPALQTRVASLSALNFKFHGLTSAPSFLDTLTEQGEVTSAASHSTGFISAILSYFVINKFLIPWTSSEYLKLYHEISQVVQEVRPDLCVVDSLFFVGLDACLGEKQKHIVLSPVQFKGDQGLKNFNFPAVSSGYAYPLGPVTKPLNYLLMIIMTLCIAFGGIFRSIEKARKQANILHPFPSLLVPSKNLTISASAPECDYPHEPNPALSLPVGPIVQPIQSLEEIDPHLFNWISRKPTILLVLGSHVRTTEKMSLELSLGFKKVLEKRNDVQLLWKVRKGSEGFDPLDTIHQILKKELEEDRIKIVDWLKADPVSLLASSHICCFVNHGGANCFLEGIYTGVPQVILACWYDTMDNASKAEYLGVGLFGNRGSAPDADHEQFSTKLLMVIGDGSWKGEEAAALMKKRALEVMERSRKRGGARRAADKILELTR